MCNFALPSPGIPFLEFQCYAICSIRISISHHFHHQFFNHQSFYPPFPHSDFLPKLPKLIGFPFFSPFFQRRNQSFRQSRATQPTLLLIYPISSSSSPRAPEPGQPQSQASLRARPAPDPSQPQTQGSNIFYPEPCEHQPRGVADRSVASCARRRFAGGSRTRAYRALHAPPARDAPSRVRVASADDAPPRLPLASRPTLSHHGDNALLPFTHYDILLLRAFSAAYFQWAFSATYFQGAFSAAYFQGAFSFTYFQGAFSAAYFQDGCSYCARKLVEDRFGLTVRSKPPPSPPPPRPPHPPTRTPHMVQDCLCWNIIEVIEINILGPLKSSAFVSIFNPRLGLFYFLWNCCMKQKKSLVWAKFSCI